jgi:UDP-N-acetylmuramate dehydrogenase
MPIERDKSLREFNTFGIDASAKYFAEVRSPDDLRALVSEPLYQRERRLILGGGSNVLFTGDYDGLVIKNSIPGIELLRQDSEHVWVRAGAGEVWHAFVLSCVERGFAGVENLSLIPGQVGAAPIQNIGAYGVEMESTCQAVEALHMSTGEPVTFSRDDCEFSYRNSVFKGRFRDQFLVTAVTFRLDKRPRFEIGYGDLKKTLDEMQVTELTVRAVSDAVIRIRSSKLPDPKVLGNAGSFFQNPVVTRESFERLAAAHPSMPHFPLRSGAVKIPAGWLIEQCGWKGMRVGRAGVHRSHALVLVNHGGATAEEIHRLAMEIRRSVQERFGIELVPEVNIV